MRDGFLQIYWQNLCERTFLCQDSFNVLCSFKPTRERSDDDWRSVQLGVLSRSLFNGSSTIPRQRDEIGYLARRTLNEEEQNNFDQLSESLIQMMKEKVSDPHSPREKDHRSLCTIPRAMPSFRQMNPMDRCDRCSSFINL
jgi:hypothetical protein